MHKSNRILQAVIAAVFTVSSILYALADRYLIQHVEIANVSAYAAAVTETVQPSSVNTSGSMVSSVTSLVSSQVNQSASSQVTATPTTSTVQSDDWNYQSEDTSISVRKVGHRQRQRHGHLLRRGCSACGCHATAKRLCQQQLWSQHHRQHLCYRAAEQRHFRHQRRLLWLPHTTASSSATELSTAMCRRGSGWPSIKTAP